MCENRDKLYKEWKRKPTDMRRRSLYTQYRNVVSKKILLTKNNFYRTQFGNANNNIKKTWSIINDLITKKPEGIDTIILKNMKEQDTYLITENFAEYFDENVEETIQHCDEKISDTNAKVTTSNSIFLGETT